MSMDAEELWSSLQAEVRRLASLVAARRIGDDSVELHAHVWASLLLVFDHAARARMHAEWRRANTTAPPEAPGPKPVAQLVLAGVPPMEPRFRALLAYCTWNAVYSNIRDDGAQVIAQARKLEATVKTPIDWSMVWEDCREWQENTRTRTKGPWARIRSWALREISRYTASPAGRTGARPGRNGRCIDPNENYGYRPTDPGPVALSGDASQRPQVSGDDHVDPDIDY